jgi:NAD(P)-dependent dehydrogenase (short-subunit alcohol dehydrogenase family)
MLTGSRNTPFQFSSIFSGDRPLEGKVFGVTGGTKGIGEATVFLLAHLGASVATFSRSETQVGTLLKILDAAKVDALCETGDLGDRDFVDGFINRIEQRWGRLDGWVNNAMLNTLQTFDSETEENFLRALQVNMIGPFRIAKRIAPLLASSRGSIVNVSSVVAHQADPGSLSYTTQKSGLEGLTRSLAIELAPRRIRVNTVTPGLILTHDAYFPVEGDPEAKLKHDHIKLMGENFQPWPDPGLAEDCAHAIVFLLSDAARFITGTNLFVDGGMCSALRPVSNLQKAQAGLRIDQMWKEIVAGMQAPARGATADKI